jgi:cytoskeletal protein CcmA (bactofilin family)
MFGKENKKDADVPVTSSSYSSSSSSSNSSSRPVSKEVTTLIGEGCKVEGNFFVPTTTRIDGTIKGDLTGEIGVIIGTQGLIEGNVCSAEVVVYGNIKGNIEADKLELKRGSIVNGDLSVNTLLTEPGASFNGKCAMKMQEANVTELSAQGGQ